MHISPLPWQSLTPEYNFIEQGGTASFFDFQITAKQALDQFMLSEMGSALILKSETFPEYIQAIQAYLSEGNQPLLFKNEYDRKTLFGYQFYREKTQQLEYVEGIIQSADQHILMLNLNALLADISLWDKLKQALLFQQYQPYAEGPLPQPLSVCQTAFKLVLIGDRDDIAVLFRYDENLYQFCHYAEIENDCHLTADNRQKWGNYVQSLAEKWSHKRFSSAGLNQFWRYLIRDSENQFWVSISPTLLKKHLIGLATFYPNVSSFHHIEGYFAYLAKQSAGLNHYVLQDILTEQVYIQTEDEEVGQINGLSVVEFDGLPEAFGEPLRISCNVQYGDGEIHDIERKVELGGNIHSKGILLAQSCLANLLELPTQLPFSASLAFEQSYGEIDGDSSSLAIFCVLTSALSQLPLPQSLAVTGAIDQFGNVLSVGGVNQKIEGFFKLCQARELTGKQGVVIPRACLSHLSLQPEVMAAIKQGKFHLWAVSDVFEAVELLLNRPFYEDDEQPSAAPSLFRLIHQGIEQHDQPETSGRFVAKIRKWFGLTSKD